MKNKLQNSIIPKLVCVLTLILVSLLGKSQVDFKIFNYSSIASTSITFKVQIQAPGSTTLPSTTIPMIFSSSLITGFISINYASNYASYTSSPTFSSGTLTVSTTAPGSPTTIANVYEDFCTIVMTNTGVVTDLTNITFGSITGVTTGSTIGLFNQVLPVKFLTVSVKEQNGYNILNWVTGLEINSDFFQVERSLDGKKFEPIGRIKGAFNTTNITTYNFVDSNTKNLDVLHIYYRIKQVDFGGRYYYSAVRTVSLKELSSIKVYPNPTSGNSKLIISSFVPTDINVSITDIAGKLIYSKNVYTKTGINQLEIDLKSCADGVYFVTVTQPSKVNILRLMKQQIE